MMARGGARPNNWTKGKAPKSPGRPRIPEDVKEAARAMTPEALETLRTSLKSKVPSVRVMAANSILDRGWGKPSQSVDVKATVSLEQLVAASLPAEETK